MPRETALAEALKRPVSRRPSVVFVINSPVVGGAERHTFDLAGGLRARGFSTTIFAIKGGHEALEERVLAPDPALPFSLRARVAALRRCLVEMRPDVVVGVNERPILVTCLATRGARSGARTAGVLHSTRLRHLGEYAVALAHYPFFYALDSLIFVSERQRAQWARLGLRPSSATTILNGVDTAQYSVNARESLRASARERYGFSPEDVVVGLSAVFRPEKNHAQLLEVVARLRGEGAPLRALLIGDGPRRAEIEARAAALGVSDRIIITGLQPDVRPCLAACDIGVNCSVAIETLSLAALEMLAMGIPLVMSDIGGASEMIDGRNGALFPRGDDMALLRSIRLFLSSERRAEAGRAARARVLADFDQRAMCDRYAGLFSTLAGTPGNSRRGRQLP